MNVNDFKLMPMNLRKPLSIQLSTFLTYWSQSVTFSPQIFIDYLLLYNGLVEVYQVWDNI